MVTGSCHRIPLGYAIFVWPPLAHTENAYPRGILWQLSVAIGFWHVQGVGQNPTVDIKYHKRLTVNQTHQVKIEVVESEQQIPSPRQVQIPGLRQLPVAIGLVEVEQQFAIPNPRSTATPNPRSTATPSCHRIGGSWAAICNSKSQVYGNPKSQAYGNPKSQVYGNSQLP